MDTDGQLEWLVQDKTDLGHFGYRRAKLGEVTGSEGTPIKQLLLLIRPKMGAVETSGYTGKLKRISLENAGVIKGTDGSPLNINDLGPMIVR